MIAEGINLNGRAVIRVMRGEYLVGYFGSVEELASKVDLAELEVKS